MNLAAPLVARKDLPGPYAVLEFRHPPVAAEARAGQFVMLKAEAALAPLLRRPFSIMTVDREAGTFSVFLKTVGPGSRALGPQLLAEQVKGGDAGPGPEASCVLRRPHRRRPGSR